MASGCVLIMIYKSSKIQFGRLPNLGILRRCRGASFSEFPKRRGSSEHGRLLLNLQFLLRLSPRPGHETRASWVVNWAIDATYVAGQGEGISVNEYDALDDDRVLERIEPCIPSEADQRVFLLACKQGVRDWRRLQEIANEAKNEGSDAE